jgi:hypothetical protein
LSKLGLNESVGPKVLRFSYSFSISNHIIAYYAYHNFKDKNIKLHSNTNTRFVVLTIILFLNDIGGNAIMADDATMSSNPLVMLVPDK